MAASQRLVQELSELERRVQAQANEESCFRKLNMAFNAQNETTQMLLDVCERLAQAKDVMQRANFEEHTSELPYLCSRFGTTIECGLSDRAYREMYTAQHPHGSGRRYRRRGGSFLALCCQQDFPPHQGWWMDVSKHLNPSIQVLRAGRLTNSSLNELVPGDVVYVHAGQRIPVDGRVLVFTEGSMVDMSQLTNDVTDVRASSSEPTSETLTLSRNMVFKDSYVVSGSLFFLAVRSAADPILATGSRERDGDEFVVDMNLPPGLSMGQCKSTFKALCIQARLACRSFRALVQLGRVGALVVLLTQELLGTAAALCEAARRLQRALVLVGCDCSHASLEALAGEAALEFLDLDSADSAPSVPSAPSAPPRADGGTPRDAGCLEGSQPLLQGEVAQLVQLAQRLGSQRAGGAVLARLSQAGLGTLCGQLTDVGLPPLYAVGNLDFPDTFKALVLASRKSSASRTLASTTSPPKCSAVSLSTDVPDATPAQTSAAQDDALRMDAKRTSRLHSLGSTASAGTSTLSRDPAAMLSIPRNAAARSSIELLVSLDSIGVVSEHADCVLLKPDLLCLAQALDIAAKAVASAPAPAARAEPGHA